jgi:hypothetical protein
LLAAVDPVRARSPRLLILARALVRKTSIGKALVDLQLLLLKITI